MEEQLAAQLAAELAEKLYLLRSAGTLSRLAVRPSSAKAFLPGKFFTACKKRLAQFIHYDQ